MTKKRQGKRDNFIQVTLLDDEKALVDSAAEISGLATAAFIRNKALEAAREALHTAMVNKTKAG